MPWLRTEARRALADVRISRNASITAIINRLPSLAFGISGITEFLESVGNSRPSFLSSSPAERTITARCCVVPRVMFQE
jgi:hypothetical protein